MKYLEEKLSFIEDKGTVLSRSLGSTQQSPQEAPEILGLTVRIGNEPIVRNLKSLYKASNKALPPDLKVLFDKNDLYMIVHTIGAIRLEGKAKVDELQYHAHMPDMPGVRTIDLLPNTTFKDQFKLNVGIKGAISGNGCFSASIPESLCQSLTGKNLSLGSNMDIELSACADFIGTFTYHWKFPVVQSLGIASNTCTWVLNPRNIPLLGDQLLIQTLSVPKGTKKVSYRVRGVCKADKGLFWKQQVLRTAEHVVEVDLL